MCRYLKCFDYKSEETGSGHNYGLYSKRGRECNGYLCDQTQNDELLPTFEDRPREVAQTIENRNDDEIARGLVQSYRSLHHVSDLISRGCTCMPCFVDCTIFPKMKQ